MRPCVCFSKDVNDQNSHRYPSLYRPGQLNLLFNKKEFFLSTLQGLGTSFVLFFIPYGAYSISIGDDGFHISDRQAFAVTIATSLVIVVSVQIGFITHYWTVVNHFFVWGSLAIYFAILFALNSDGIFGIFPNNFSFVGTARNCLSQRSVWLVILLTTMVCVTPGLLVRFLRADFYPTQTDKVRRLQQASRKQGPREQNLRRVRRTSSRRSAYAFAHQQGYGELITSGKNMKVTPAPSSSSPGRLQNSPGHSDNRLRRTGATSVSGEATRGSESRAAGTDHALDKQHNA